jgi:hypothetical protein
MGKSANKPGTKLLLRVPPTWQSPQLPVAFAKGTYTGCAETVLVAAMLAMANKLLAIIFLFIIKFS